MKGLACAVALAMSVTLLSACSADGGKPQSSTSNTPEKPLATVVIGTLQTDDLLPLWVAQSSGFAAENGIDLVVETFASAQEQIAAVTAGAVDGIMTDLVVPVQLSAAGTPMRLVSVLQGAPAGIVVGADSGIESIADLGDVSVGCSSPTVMEYILETALKTAGVPSSQWKTEEIKKLPVRLQMLLSGHIKAAVLPWTLHAYAVQGGAISLLGPGQADSVTSTVLAFRDAFLEEPGASEVISAIWRTWDAGVAAVNTDPSAYLELLRSKANLPDDLVYLVRTYPSSTAVPQGQVEAVVTWMVAKGYIDAPVPFDNLKYPG